MGLHLSHFSSFKNSDTSEPQTLEMKVNQPPQGQNLLALDQVLRCIQSEIASHLADQNLVV